MNNLSDKFVCWTPIHLTVGNVERLDVEVYPTPSESQMNFCGQRHSLFPCRCNIKSTVPVSNFNKNEKVDTYLLERRAKMGKNEHDYQVFGV